MQTGTIGQILVNDAFPKEMRGQDRVLDKAGLKAALRQVAMEHPEQYREVTHKLANIGHRIAQATGGYSFGLQHLRKSLAAVKTRQNIQSQVDQILENETIPDKQREAMIVKVLSSNMKSQQEAVFNEAVGLNNPLAMQVLSGSRGSKMTLNSLLGSDLLYADHRDRPIPIPVLRSYSEGMSPEEYWAGAYGARKGIVATKFATQEAGFFGKQLNQIAHRLLVTGEDYDTPEQQGIQRGMPVDTDDMDNEGALLAHDIGPYKKNMVLTPRVMKHLKRLGHERILVRSPMVGGSPEGGIYARDAGVREKGVLPGRGEQVGLTAAQALAEPISQGMLSTKHSGGVAGEEKAMSGFDFINQLVQIPKSFKGGAIHAQNDGTIQRIEPAPAGGQYVTIDGVQHYAHQDFPLKVKKGDVVEAGDVLSEGVPNPAEITKHKGIGEGRKYFTHAMRQAMQDAGINAHRRNIEVLSRGLINHVRFTDEYEDKVPDDVIPYSTLEHTWQPREGHQVVVPKSAIGHYLEKPVLHYTIGTRIKPSMLKDFEDFKVPNLTVHKDPPPFAPEMIRGMYSLQNDPDWMTRMYGSGLKKSILHSVQRGGKSEERGTSFVPSLARGVDFGRIPGSMVTPPSPGYKPEYAPDFKIAEDDSFQPPPPPVKADAGLSNVPGNQGMNASFNKAVPAPAPAGPKPMADVSGIKAVNPSGDRLLTGPNAPKPATVTPPSAGYSPPGLLGSPFAVPIMQSMEQAAPGIGGVMSMAAMADKDALGTLLAGPGSGHGVANAAPAPETPAAPPVASPEPAPVSPNNIMPPAESPGSQQLDERGNWMAWEKGTGPAIKGTKAVVGGAVNAGKQVVNAVRGTTPSPTPPPLPPKGAMPVSSPADIELASKTLAEAGDPAADAARYATEANRGLQAGERVEQLATKSGRVVTFVRDASGKVVRAYGKTAALFGKLPGVGLANNAAKGVGGWGTALALAIDAGEVLTPIAKGAYNDGLQGADQAASVKADETAEGLRGLWNNEAEGVGGHASKGLQTMGAVFSPFSNLNVTQHGVRELNSAINETDAAGAKAEQLQTEGNALADQTGTYRAAPADRYVDKNSPMGADALVTELQSGHDAKADNQYADWKYIQHMRQVAATAAAKQQQGLPLSGDERTLSQRWNQVKGMSKEDALTYLSGGGNADVSIMGNIPGRQTAGAIGNWIGGLFSHTPTTEELLQGKQGNDEFPAMGGFSAAAVAAGNGSAVN